MFQHAKLLTSKRSCSKFIGVIWIKSLSDSATRGHGAGSPRRKTRRHDRRSITKPRQSIIGFVMGSLDIGSIAPQSGHLLLMTDVSIDSSLRGRRGFSSLYSSETSVGSNRFSRKFLRRLPNSCERHPPPPPTITPPELMWRVVFLLENGLK